MIALPRNTHYLERWQKGETRSDAWKAALGYFLDVGWTPLKTFALLFVLAEVFVGPYAFYAQARDLAARQSQEITLLKNENNDLRIANEFKRNTLNVRDPAFMHAVWVLQAFRAYYFRLGGTVIPCEVEITSPANGGDLPILMAQLSIQADNCATFGPMKSDANPDVERITNNGMVPGAIVFHAARNDKAADALFDGLTSLVPLKRSYDLPSPEELFTQPTRRREPRIWLQFGSDVKWNDQPR